MTQQLPSKVQDWIVGMVRGKRYVNVGHMMFSTNENFRTQSFEEGLNLIRTSGLVDKWLTDESINEAERYVRLKLVRQFTADIIRFEVIATFDKAEYHGD